MARIGYAKIGRSFRLSPATWGTAGADQEGPIMLNKLARAYPQHEFVIVGKTNDEEDDLTRFGFPSNVKQRWTADVRAEARKIWGANESPMTIEQLERTEAGLRGITEWMFDDLDGLIVWAGQHGTTNQSIPKIGQPDVMTRPQDSFVSYSGFIMNGINRWRDKDPLTHVETWLVADIRNFLKARDLKWPPSKILSLYDWSKNEKHYRYGDLTDPTTFGCEWAEPGVWKARHEYFYSALELASGIPSSIQCSLEWENRTHFGLLINEASKNIQKNTRLEAMQRWVMPLKPAWIGGTWSKESMAKLGVSIEYIPWDRSWDFVRSSRCTFTTPSSGGGWASFKPWEAFAVGTVCFFHKAYDTQGHIIPTTAQVERGEVDHSPELKHLAQWLRTDTPEQLAKRVHVLNHDRDAWLWIVTQQKRLLDAAMAEQRCIKLIAERYGL